MSLSTAEKAEFRKLTATVGDLANALAKAERDIQVLKDKVNPIEVKVPKRGRPKKSE